MTEWFRRKSEKIKTFDKREIAEDVDKMSWMYRSNLSKNAFEQNYVCISCSHHFRITSSDYIDLLIDNNNFTEFCKNITSVDPLQFNANKKYTDQVTIAQAKTGSKDAVKTIIGNINGVETVLAIMDFSFIGGSMGSVVGEKIARSIDKARELKSPLFIVTASGGARMQEGAYSLMQLAKISTKLAQFSDEGGLYVVLLTDPTTGGTTASFAMLGDIILAEPNALIGFAGARVIKQTIGEELPEGFQRAEFLLEKGFVDSIVDRSNLKSTLTKIFTFFGYRS